MNSILSDILVIDLSRVVAGPYCTMMLGDMGATVIKIERPRFGDDTRGFGPPYADGQSAYYLEFNRNKKSITLDFSTPEGQDQLLALLRNAAVLVENFRPGTLDAKGFGYETLRALNPGLIYCSISGYGQTGPRAMLPGYDFIAQAESGLMSVTGEVDGPPVPVGAPIIDLTAGTFACTAILAALRVRDKTGQGQRIDISLLESAISLLGYVAGGHLVSGEEAQRFGNGHPNIVPYQTFSTGDGHIAIACGNDHLYTMLCRVLGCEELASDARFVTNEQRDIHRQELIPQLQERFLTKNTAEWFALLHKAGVPCGLINHVSEVFRDPQIKARGLVWEYEHPDSGPVRLVGSPMHLSETPLRLYSPPPQLGEDNDLLLDLTQVTAEGEAEEMEKEPVH